MTDVHCHILPGIDDGAKSFDESLVLLRKAEAAGITDIILTPHYIRGSVYNADNVRKWELFTHLRELAAAAGLSVRLYLGNEIYIDGRVPGMLGKYTGDAGSAEDLYELSTLNSTKYVLVEFPVQMEDKSAKDTLFSLVSKGLVPVIAHPERYYYVQNDPSKVDEWLAMGCLLQGDYLALTGKYGKLAEKTLKKLLFADKIFCLASDVHHGTDEYNLEAARKKLLRVVREPLKMEQLLEGNPRRILCGE